MSGAFSKAIATFAKKTNARIDQVHRVVVFQIYRNVILRTPQDTGRARASWLIGDNVIPSTFHPEVPKGGHAAPPDFGAAARISGAGSITHITNNVPYIIALEEGHSQVQAPHGMMRITVAEIQAKFGGMVRSLR